MLEYIKAKNKVSIKELSQLFSNVSLMTIHRDLENMEKRGLIDRVRGGAWYRDDQANREPSFNVREVANRDLKERIARKAVKIIPDGSSVFIDSGTTASALASLIENIPLSIITNSPTIAMNLANKKFINVMLCGGTLEKKNLSLYGSAAVQTLEKINIDIAFVVASGFSKESGFTCGNDGETVIKNLICRKAHSVAMLLDSTKIGTVLPFTFATEDDIDYLICDKPLPEAIAEKMREKGVTIL